MPLRLALIAGLVLSLMLNPARAGWDDLLKQGEKLLQPGATDRRTTATPARVDNTTLAAGLKEALRVGGERAIERLAARGGYADHAEVRIPMPGLLDSVGGLMRQYGLGAQVDAFEASMNTAAEQAISEATPIFMDTLDNMTLDDARRIYSGGDTAATDYFRAKTHDPLSARLQPLIEQAMASTGVIQAYQLLVGQAEQQLPLLRGMSPDLGAHVTAAALDGLFLRLAEEEQQIRQNPLARTTDLLQTVFGP